MCYSGSAVIYEPHAQEALESTIPGMARPGRNQNGNEKVRHRDQEPATRLPRPLLINQGHCKASGALAAETGLCCPWI